MSVLKRGGKQADPSIVWFAPVVNTGTVSLANFAETREYT